MKRQVNHIHKAFIRDLLQDRNYLAHIIYNPISEYWFLLLFTLKKKNRQHQNSKLIDENM